MSPYMLQCLGGICGVVFTCGYHTGAYPLDMSTERGKALNLHHIRNYRI